MIFCRAKTACSRTLLSPLCMSSLIFFFPSCCSTILSKEKGCKVKGNLVGNQSTSFRMGGNDRILRDPCTQFLDFWDCLTPTEKQVFYSGVMGTHRQPPIILDNSKVVLFKLLHILLPELLGVNRAVFQVAGRNFLDVFFERAGEVRYNQGACQNDKLRQNLQVSLQESSHVFKIFR